MPLSSSEKKIEVEKAGPASAWLRPDSVVIDTPTWFQVTTPSSKLHWLNRVSRSILTAKEAPEKVARTIAGYRDAGQSFWWNFGPSTTPASLGEILESHGMKFHHLGLGMCAEVDSIRVVGNPDVVIERTTLANVDPYVKASVAGWGNTEEAAKEVRADMIRSLGDPKHRTRYFTAFYQGEPAATGALLPLERSGYLLASSVVPKFRGQGVYRALVAHRLEVLRSMRIPLATIHAMATTSAPICKKLGFETVFEMRSYLLG